MQAGRRGEGEGGRGSGEGEEEGVSWERRVGELGRKGVVTRYTTLCLV